MPTTKTTLSVDKRLRLSTYEGGAVTIELRYNNLSNPSSVTYNA